MSLDIEPRVTRSAPTPWRVALASIALRACDPLARDGRRDELWRVVELRDPPPECFGDFPRVLSRVRRAMLIACARLLMRARSSFVESGAEAIVETAARATREAFATADAADVDSSALREIESWALRRIRDDLFELDGLERVEEFFEDVREACANASADEARAPDGYEVIAVEGYSEIGMFLKRCFLGFSLMPLEATVELARGVRAFALDVENACEGGRFGAASHSARTCAAPDALTTYVCDAVETLERQSLGVERTFPEGALDELEALAPELPTLHYLRHAEALRKRDYPAAVEHLHRHFDVSGDTTASAIGAASNLGGFESANAGRERLQTALLALGSMQIAFSHVDEAMFAISEAVRTAQQNADEASLAHALALTTALLSDTPVRLAGQSLYRDVQLPTLLRRCAAQAAELSSPHLIAYAALALTKYAIDNPDVTSGGESRLRGSAMQTAKREDELAPPLIAMKSLNDVECARHLSQLQASTPASAAALALASDATVPESTVNTGNDLYATPKGFPSTPTCAYTASATASSLRSLAGTASVLASEGWSAYGCTYLSKLYALRQLYHDRDASIEVTAKSCALLIAHASECEGVAEASNIRRLVESMFGDDVWSHKTIAVAFLKLKYEFAMGENDYAEARDAVGCMRQLVDDNSGTDNALYFESRRFSADLSRACGDFDDAQAELIELIEDAKKVRNLHAEMWAKLSLAETHLSADAPSLALMRALPLELEAAEHGLEPIRTTALCIMCESWLKLGGSHAQLARHALDERLLILLSSDSLRVQCRAYLASARALIATTPREDFSTIAERVIDALERAAERSSRLGARALEQMCRAEIASAHHACGDFASRDRAAAKCRALARC